MGRVFGRLGALTAILAVAGDGGCAGRDMSPKPVDLVVFAPHPDDEALGCSGVLRQALARGERIKVVLFTSGDGFPVFASLLCHKPVERLEKADFRELARYRQLQAETALEALGGSRDDVVFLGYPDSGLGPVYETRDGNIFRQKFSGQSETYGAAKADYHYSVHGSPAPYAYESVLADVEELLRSLRPRRICVTHESDQHPDHRAAYRFVRDAVLRTGYAGEVDTYLIHGGPEWPWPRGRTPEAPFESHEVKGTTVPLQVPWPPSRRVPLSPQEALYKDAAIRAHTSHLTGVTTAPLLEERIYLESFVKSEEVFWVWERR